MSDWQIKKTAYNTIFYFKYINYECVKHGLCEHILAKDTPEIKITIPNMVCRECCRDEDKRRSYRKKHQESNSQSQKIQPRGFWNDN